MQQKCLGCKKEQDNSAFPKGRKKCKNCYNKLAREVRASKPKRKKQTPEEIKTRRKKHYNENREKILKQRKEYRENNKEICAKSARKSYYKYKSERLAYHKEYRRKNKEKIIQRRRKYEAKQMKENPLFRIRKHLRNAIYCALIRNDSTKNNLSILKYLPYTIEDLKQHLEKQFESWMNWDNWGSYSPKKWDDNDISTWTWQIDHLIPHCNFKYISMEDEEFGKCWALENLRPYSSKQNNIDNARQKERNKNDSM
jgi:hypothetical protein